MAHVDEISSDERDKQALQHIEDVTIHASQIQRQILTQILSTNADVEYLQQHGLHGSTELSTFKNLIPLISYEQLRPYIDRIANGDDSPILCTNPITEFFISSGTSGGEPKLIPMYEEEFMRRLSFFDYVMPRMKQLFPNSLVGKGKGMHFQFAKVELKTRSGIVAHTATTSLCKRANLNNTSPKDIILCTDTNQSLYCQLLCGLCQNDIVFRVGALFASTLIHVLKFLEDHWVVLASDIRAGTLNTKITDPSVREAVMNILNPNAQLADFIEAECSKGTWEGIITRLWPNAKYINAIVTGSMAQYLPKLNYYSNHLPIVSDHYGASECFLGLNLDPLCSPDRTSYTLIPTMAYFEFLPIDRTKSSRELSRELVDLVDVKLGHEYELVITTYAGLYRYRMGDILGVTGFKNKAPNFSFVCRKNVVLSLDIEKTDEAELHDAVQEAARLLSPFGAAIADYTSHADSSKIPGHYVLYWEIHVKGGISIPSSIYEDCCFAIEELLNGPYRYLRSHEKCINPLEIKIVKVGTFEKLMAQALNRGASMSQYKTPRCVNSTHIIELLDSNVVIKYFSKKCPKVDTKALHRLLS
ncbi:indole-3-acetic acid-amido synthetase GH3.6-like [Cucurbita moschata]|uniref:Indole-3-acetic acid-amido synthetase GH3.6-like n=1 Tax=Cucurbita moschata TaxID=3662 RepID=A0A6J1FUU5_CUCMO|nr:indole-3-acetic acid-amido synthetase GH3.6-like [Cucurbita moschata]